MHIAAVSPSLKRHGDLWPQRQASGLWPGLEGFVASTWLPILDLLVNAWKIASPLVVSD